MTTELARGILGVSPRKCDTDPIDVLLGGAKAIREAARRFLNTILRRI